VLHPLLRPTQFLPDLEGSCQETVVCHADLTAGGIKSRRNKSLSREGGEGAPSAGYAEKN
jgi:hypothetical protein